MKKLYTDKGKLERISLEVTITDETSQGFRGQEKIPEGFRLISKKDDIGVSIREFEEMDESGKPKKGERWRVTLERIDKDGK